jgi:hypothetical protein
VLVFLGTILPFLLISIIFAVVFSQKPDVVKPPAVMGRGSIAVDYASPLRKIDPLSIGMDISGYGAPNSLVNDLLEQKKLQALGITFARIELQYSKPGDLSSKIVCGANGCDTRWSGDQWIQAIRSTGAEPLITVPYDAREAAAMVKHFNTGGGDAVHYWLIGNEPDLTGMSAARYSALFNQDYDAMKAINPTIKIGGGTTAWYDAPFLQTFVQQCGSRVDFIDFHLYAQQGNEAGSYTTLFQTAENYGEDIHALRALLQAFAPARASKIRIEVGEWELNWGGGAQNQTNFHAVWVASVLGHILDAGGRSLFYADKDNAIYGQPQTSTDASGHVIAIHVDDTGPAYQGIGMFTGEGVFQGFGNTLLKATTTLPNIEVYASDHPKTILVINKDPSLSQIATLNLHELTGGNIKIWRKDGTAPFLDPPVPLGGLSFQQGSFTYRFPPFSVTSFAVTPTETSTPVLFRLPALAAEAVPRWLLLFLVIWARLLLGHGERMLQTVS